MNKMLVCIILPVLFCLRGLAQSVIVAEIGNFKNDNGVCRACLFDNPASYEGKTNKPVQCVAAFVKGHSALARFDNIPTGTYAIFFYHDANNNNKMDRNFIGIPREGYGASKNKLPYASAPTFAENKFTIANKTTITLRVKLRNL